MDRSLDDVIQERQRRPSRPSRDRRPPRDGVRKNQRNDENRSLDRDWVHDRYDEDSETRRPRESRPVRLTRRDPVDPTQVGTKVKVENIHYDLTEDDLQELFSRIGLVRSVSLVYDRQDRSTGIAYVVYPDPRDARAALDEFDGANANGQPIRLSLVSNLAGNRTGRNPFDTAERPSRSLFDRIERRTDSDDEPTGRRSNMNRPAPDYIDRYVPGQETGGRNNSGRRSPRRDGRQTRRPGQRRQPREPRDTRDTDGPPLVQGRPRKTADELDAEMEDYWGGGAEQKPAEAANGADQDVDMDI